jgi:Ca2+-binding RTX toxin-like protein
MNTQLQAAYLTATNALTAFANSTTFYEKLQMALGNQYDLSRAEEIRQQWAQGVFELPIEVVDVLGTAHGAYAASNNRIYLSANFLANYGDRDVAATLIEEVGHWLDAQINSNDSAGDEGHIFSALVRGVALSSAELAALQREDDRAIIQVNGQRLVVEQANITGTANGDFLSGTTNADLINGLGGDDSVTGGDGNDTINGGAGDDDIYGEDGNDSLLGGSGSDLIFGGSQFSFGFGLDGNDTIDAGTGDDFIVAGSGLSVVNGNLGVDSLTFDASLATINITASLAAVSFTATGSTFTGIERFEDLITGSGNDLLTGSLYRDYMNSGSGNDRVNGGGGNDEILGGDGNDSINGGNGDDILYGGQFFNFGVTVDGNDTIRGDNGNDEINGGSGNNVIDGGAGIDSVILDLATNSTNLSINLTTGNFNVGGNTVTSIERFGNLGEGLTTGSGNDIVIGGAYRDSIRTGAGNDSVTAAEGADNVSAGGGNDTINGGRGRDAIYGDIGNDSINGDSGDDFLQGGDGNDVIIGVNGKDRIDGGTGNDRLDGGAGNDTFDLAVGGGVDTVIGGLGIDLVSGSLTTLTTAINLNISTGIFALAGSNFTSIEQLSLLSGSGKDSITGGIYVDFISGGAGNDTINGGGGSDRLNGEAGNDRIDGGSGSDTISAGIGIDTIIGGAGIDAVDVSLTTNTTNLIANISTTNFYLAGSTYNSIERFASLATGSGNDSITGGTYADNMFSGAGNDTLNGAAGDDSLAGRLGNDSLIGGLGSDTLAGEEGNDRLLGGDGNDLLGGGDTFLYNFGFVATLDGNDFVDGGAGDDTIVYRNGLDTITGGTGNDQLNYKTSNTTTAISINISTGNFTFLGSTFTSIEELDILTGAGNDTITGGALEDNINAGGGNNSINAGAGDDHINISDGTNIVNAGLGIDGITLSNPDDLSGAPTNVNISTGNFTLNGSTYTSVEKFDYFQTGAGNDSIVGGIYADYIGAGKGNDTVNGGSGSDSIAGGKGDDSLLGGDGNDILYGGEIFFYPNDFLRNFATSDGDDRIFGGNGDDFISAGSGINVVDGGAGVDGIALDLSAIEANLSLNISTGNFTVAGSSFTSIERLGNANLTNGFGLRSFYNAVDYFQSGQGNDNIVGGIYTDDIGGGNGNDTINSGVGDDYIAGNAGDDSLIGGDGNDYYAINAGLDVGQDTIVETVANGDMDVLDFSVSDVDINVDLNILTAQTIAANVRLVLGTNAIEGVIGGRGDDIIKGNALANEFYRTFGEDTVGGGVGNDKFYLDTFSGGFGNDSLGGGFGNDNARPSETMTIVDFAVGQDKIVLRKSFFTAITSEVGAAIGTNFASVATDALVANSAAAIVYSVASHKLFYNVNGVEDGLGDSFEFFGNSGFNLTGRGGELAYFSNNANITTTDFMLAN